MRRTRKRSSLTEGFPLIPTMKLTGFVTALQMSAASRSAVRVRTASAPAASTPRRIMVSCNSWLLDCAIVPGKRKRRSPSCLNACGNPVDGETEFK